MFWGPMSDHIGRRPISAACLLILALSCVGLALVPTSDFWLLMLLRCLQASGSASTIAIGASSLSDARKNSLISLNLTEFRRRRRSG
jgi:MFS family permease